MKKVLFILVLTLVLVFTSFKESSAGSTVGDGFYINIVEGSKVFYGEEVVFEYDFDGGYLLNINGSIYESVEDGDFIIDNINQTVTISSRYLYQILDRRSDISMTVFSWVFNSYDGSNTVVGYLFIDLQKGKDLYTKELIVKTEQFNLNEKVIVNNKLSLLDSLKDLANRINNVFKIRSNYIRLKIIKFIK